MSSKFEHFVDLYTCLIQVQLLLCRSLSHYLLLPWPNLPENEQNWLDRAAHHRSFVQQLAQQFLSLKGVTAFADNKSLQEEGKYQYTLCISLFY